MLGQPLSNSSFGISPFPPVFIPEYDVILYAISFLVSLGQLSLLPIPSLLAAGAEGEAVRALTLGFF